MALLMGTGSLGLGAVKTEVAVKEGGVSVEGEEAERGVILESLVAAQPA